MPTIGFRWSLIIGEHLSVLLGVTKEQDHLVTRFIRVTHILEDNDVSAAGTLSCSPHDTFCSFLVSIFPHVIDSSAG